MLESVSPYALLRASIPKPASSAPTAYDLYSLAQGAPVSVSAGDPALQREPAAQDGQTSPETSQSAQQNAAARPGMMATTVPARRTHYISDIKTRHSAAVRRTTFIAPKG